MSSRGAAGDGAYDGMYDDQIYCDLCDAPLNLPDEANHCPNCGALCCDACRECIDDCFLGRRNDCMGVGVNV